MLTFILNVQNRQTIEMESRFQPGEENGEHLLIMGTGLSRMMKCYGISGDGCIILSIY
jgi:hypothetical protein